MAAIPTEYLDLLQQKTASAHLATIMSDGTPQITPVWFDYTNGKLRVNSAKGRVKVRNMREGTPVALSILDHVTEEGASAHIDSLAKKYLGKDEYPWANLVRSGSRLKLRPLRCGSWVDLQSRLQEICDRVAVSLEGGQMALQ
jgi:hypothetical protein